MNIKEKLAEIKARYNKDGMNDYDIRRLFDVIEALSEVLNEIASGEDPYCEAAIANQALAKAEEILK